LSRVKPRRRAEERWSCGLCRVSPWGSKLWASPKGPGVEVTQHSQTLVRPWSNKTRLDNGPDSRGLRHMTELVARLSSELWKVSLPSGVLIYRRLWQLKPRLWWDQRHQHERSIQGEICILGFGFETDGNRSIAVRVCCFLSYLSFAGPLEAISAHSSQAANLATASRACLMRTAACRMGSTRKFARPISWGFKFAGGSSGGRLADAVLLNCHPSRPYSQCAVGPTRKSQRLARSLSAAHIPPPRPGLN
jgi:hypothetical protein